MGAAERQRRVVISAIDPEIEGGRFPAKAVAGDAVVVTADVFCDGHDLVAGDLLWRRAGEKAWTRVPLSALGNDRWGADFTPPEVGSYEYTIDGWVDGFGSWRRDLAKRVEAGQDVAVDLEIGRPLVLAAAERAPAADAERLAEIAEALDAAAALSPELARLMAAHPDRSAATRYPHRLGLNADRERAVFSAWYELFPRSCAPEPGRHGTFADAEARLDYVADLGFDVVYLPPIHPIGRTHRKGKNNSPVCRPGDVGSPWAIGSEEGGHDAIHPELGTPGDFRRFVERAGSLGMEVALDLALQCSPDHPWVKDHPEWFRARPDGTIQYAENPPKKYQDIYPLDFGTEDREALWEEILRIVRYWIGHGVRIFRVDNPHTKPFDFWEWLIGEVRAEHPDVVFLAEAFTRPRVMERLAKLGFTQSYTYFTWRTSARELTDYLTELTRTAARHYFRPNFWPNTPDILAEQLRNAPRSAFELRLILAATLSSSYGIYGPAFELMENEPKDDVTEEYLHSEKYELRDWDLEAGESIAGLLATVNGIRREHPALRRTSNLVFHPTTTEDVLCYSKAAGDDVVLVVVNLSPKWRNSAWLELDLAALGLGGEEQFRVRDLLDGTEYVWIGPRNYVELDPGIATAHVLHVLRDRES